MLYPGEFKSLNKIPNVDIDKLIHISLSINITWALFSPANGSKDLKKYILFDNDGVLVETEKWYFEANKKSLALLGLNLEMDFYQNIMVKGGSAFELALIYNIEKDIIEKHRKLRDGFYQEFLQTKNINIQTICLKSYNIAIRLM